jgi:hypothetical protein
MPGTDPTDKSDDDRSAEGDASDREPVFDRTVERAFSCQLCGFAMTHEVGLLRAGVKSVCHNCGDWTKQVADRTELVAAAEEAAEALAGPILTERQALAYLLREVMEADRAVAAEAMGSTPSNVDNLQRRAAEKVADAEQVVEGLDALRVPEGGEADVDG